MSNPFFDHPILNSPYEYPVRHWELDEAGQPTQKIIETPSRREVHHADSKAEEAQGRRTDGICVRRRQGAFDQGAAIRSDVDHQRGPRPCGRMARIAQSQPVAGHAGDGPAASALAASQVQRRPPVLLPGRSGGNRDLADRGRAAIEQRASVCSIISPRRTRTPIPN